MDAVAARRMKLSGKTYHKGDKLTLPAGQFRDLEGVGMVSRPPAETEPEPPASTTKSKRAAKKAS